MLGTLMVTIPHQVFMTTSTNKKSQSPLKSLSFSFHQNDVMCRIGVAHARALSRSFR